MTTYKVWVSIEEIDEEADEYHDIGLPDPLGEFDTRDEACAFVDRLLAYCNVDARTVATSDLVPDEARRQAAEGGLA